VEKYLFDVFETVLYYRREEKRIPVLERERFIADTLYKKTMDT